MLAMLTLQSVSGINVSNPREASIVTSMRKNSANKVRRKARYHHGGLREALIEATLQLVVDRGAENFTLADACRAAGVTTAPLPALQEQAGDPRGDRFSRFRRAQEPRHGHCG